ncbi:MAG TPA: hypothetical protein ENK43_13755 [Planctomycetes bacterium]|nr:hypothetical protein [Planctomycetota bacterium]
MKTHAPPHAIARFAALILFLCAEAVTAPAQNALLPLPVMSDTVTAAGRPAYNIFLYNVRQLTWTDIHRLQGNPSITLEFQGEVVAIVPTDVTLNHKGVIFIASHGFQSDPGVDIFNADTSIRRVVPLLAAGYTCFYINHGSLSRMKTEGGFPTPDPKVGWTTPEILQQLRDAVKFIKYHSTWTPGSPPNGDDRQFPVDASQIILSGGSSAGVLALDIHTGDGQMAAMMSPLENVLPGTEPHDVITNTRTALATVGAAGSDPANFRGPGDHAFIYLRPNTLLHPDFQGAMTETPAGTIVVNDPWYDPNDPLIIDLFGMSPPPYHCLTMGAMDPCMDVRPQLFSDPMPVQAESEYSPLTPNLYPTNWDPAGARFLIFPQLNFDRTTQTFNPWQSATYPDPASYNGTLVLILGSDAAVNKLIGPNTPNPNNLPFTGPVLWRAGAIDRFSPQYQATSFNAACQAAGIPNRTIVLDGEGHGLRDADAEQSRLALAFISRHLDNKPDADEDGIDDATETASGTDLLDADSDGDGATDNEERLAGTNPNDPQSVFRVTDLGKFTTNGTNHVMSISFPIVAGHRYRLLKSDPGPGILTTTEHGIEALRQNLWKEVAGTPFQATSGGSHSYVITMPDPFSFYFGLGYADALATESRFFKVEVRGPNDEYLGVFTRPVGRFLGAVITPASGSGDPDGKNLLAPTFHNKELYEGKFSSTTPDQMVFDANTAPLLAATDFSGPSYLDSYLKTFFRRYVVLVTHDVLRRPPMDEPPSLETNAPKLSDHMMEGDWWPVVSRLTTTANDDTLKLDTLTSGIPVSNLTVGSSVVIRPTSSFDDLFIDPFTGTSVVQPLQVVTLRRPSLNGAVVFTCTYQGAGTLSAHEWDVAVNTQPNVVFRVAGEDIRFLPDEAAYLELPELTNPPWTNCNGDYVVPRAGYVPMRRINAYIHPQSSMSGLQEFKGVNYPVDEVHLDSNAWGDLNWSHLVESGLTGPDFTGSTSPPIASTTYFEFDDVWRMDCGGDPSIIGYLNTRFPIRTLFNVPGQTLDSISLWGYADRPAWLGTPNATMDHTNTAYYWLPPEQQWFAFDRTTTTPPTNPADFFRRKTWAEDASNQYPLIGGRGIMTNLDGSQTGIVRWVRPLTYPGDLRRDAR